MNFSTHSCQPVLHGVKYVEIVRILLWVMFIFLSTGDGYVSMGSGRRQMRGLEPNFKDLRLASRLWLSTIHVVLSYMLYVPEHWE